MSAILGLLEFIPRWLLVAIIAGMAATSCKLQIDVASAQRDVIRSHEQVATYEALMLKEAAKAAEDARAMQAKVTEAQNDARKREIFLRAAADGARGELDGLRIEIDAARDQLAGASKNAAVERAIAVGAVLQDCSRRYTGLAEKADRHVSDIRTLTDSWPK
jgi:hypothetical protein